MKQRQHDAAAVEQALAGRREAGEAVPAQVELLQRRQVAERVGERVERGCRAGRAPAAARAGRGRRARWSSALLRRSRWRSSPSAGDRLGQRRDAVVAQVQLAQLSQAPDRRRQRRQRVAVEPQLDELIELADPWRQLARGRCRSRRGSSASASAGSPRAAPRGGCRRGRASPARPAARAPAGSVARRLWPRSSVRSSTRSPSAAGTDSSASSWTYRCRRRVNAVTSGGTPGSGFPPIESDSRAGSSASHAGSAESRLSRTSRWRSRVFPRSDSGSAVIPRPSRNSASADASIWPGRYRGSSAGNR